MIQLQHRLLQDQRVGIGHDVAVIASQDDVKHADLVNDAAHVIVFVEDLDAVTDAVGKAKEDNHAGGDVAQDGPLRKQGYTHYGEDRRKKHRDFAVPQT